MLLPLPRVYFPTSLGVYSCVRVLRRVRGLVGNDKKTQVDPTVFHMLNEDPGGISFSEIGGLGEQIRELREVIELPLTNPELFIRVGIKPPKARRSHYRTVQYRSRARWRERRGKCDFARRTSGTCVSLISPFERTFVRSAFKLCRLCPPSRGLQSNDVDADLSPVQHMLLQASVMSARHVRTYVCIVFLCSHRPAVSQLAGR